MNTKEVLHNKAASEAVCSGCSTPVQVMVDLTGVCIRGYMGSLRGTRIQEKSF